MKIFNTVNQTDIDKFGNLGKYIYKLDTDNNRILSIFSSDITKNVKYIDYYIYPLHNKTYWKWVCNPPGLNWYIYKGYSLIEECLDGPQDSTGKHYINGIYFTKSAFVNHPEVIVFNNPSLSENWNVIGDLLDI